MFDSLYGQLRSRLRARAALLPPSEMNAPRRGGTTAAAVALILRRRGDAAELLIIKRALSQRDHWSGHLALPGGRRQSMDPDLCATALRETREEVGIDVARGGEVVGHLETICPRSPLAPQITVTPFVAVAPPEYHVSAHDRDSMPLTLNHEVAASFWVPVDFLKQGGRSDVFRMIVSGQERTWPAYPTDHGPIWGLTEAILTDFLTLTD